MKGVKFNDIHSYNDLDLILSKTELSPAVPKITLVDIPGGNGSLDLTEALGEVKFADRAASFTFTMNPKNGLTDSDFELKKTEVSNKLNGLACRVVFDTDPDYYYEGRTTVNSYLSDRRLRQFAVSATLKPYKMKAQETVMIESLSGTEKEIVLLNGRKTVTPTITVTQTAKIIFNGAVYDLSTGAYKLFQLTEGGNVVTVSGTGTIEFRYREGEL